MPRTRGERSKLAPALPGRIYCKMNPRFRCKFAERRQDTDVAATLMSREAELERSMLAREDILCNETMTNAERRWLAVNRPPNAKHKTLAPVD